MSSKLIVLFPAQGGMNPIEEVIGHLKEGVPGGDIAVVVEPGAKEAFRKALSAALRRCLSTAPEEEKKAHQRALDESDHVFFGDMDALGAFVARRGRQDQPVFRKAEGEGREGTPEAEDYFPSPGSLKRLRDRGIDQNALSDACCRLIVHEGAPRRAGQDLFGPLCLLELLEDLRRIVLLLQLFDDDLPRKERLLERIVTASDLEGQERERAVAVLRRLIESSGAVPGRPFPLSRCYPLKYLLHDLDYCIEDLADWFDDLRKDGLTGKGDDDHLHGEAE